MRGGGLLVLTATLGASVNVYADPDAGVDAPSADTVVETLAVDAGAEQPASSADHGACVAVANSLAEVSGCEACMQQRHDLTSCHPTPKVVEADSPRCDTGLYLEPSMFMVAATDFVVAMTRVGVGALIRTCNARGLAGTHVRLGLTGFLSPKLGAGGDAASGGFGFEVEIDHPLSLAWRAGLYANAEDALGVSGGSLVALGARFHLHEEVWFEVDVFHANLTHPTLAPTGVMTGIGVEGRAGRFAALVEAVAGSIVGIAWLSTVHVGGR